MNRQQLAAVPEPPPRPGGRPVLPDLIKMLQERSDFGLRKYGTRLHAQNGRDPYIDSVQELLDLFVYLHQAAMENAAVLTELAQVRLERDQADHRAALLRRDLEAAKVSLARALKGPELVPVEGTKGCWQVIEPGRIDHG